MTNIPLSIITPSYSTNWISTDSEEKFNEHWRDVNKRKILLENGHDRNSISYDIDSRGFRNPEGVDISESILTLGCSFTFGVGSRREDTWSHILANKLDMPYYNAGIYGTGADTCYRIVRTLVPENKPKAVYALVPDKNRLELISDFVYDGSPSTFSVWTLSDPDYDEQFGNFFDLIMDEFPLTLQQERNILSMEQICFENGVPFYYIISENLKFEYGFENNARDLEHPGIRYNNDIADMFYEICQKG